jgi:hypothetical protein
MCLYTEFWYRACGHTTTLDILCSFGTCRILGKQLVVEGMFCEGCTTLETYETIARESLIAPDPGLYSHWKQLLGHSNGLRTNAFIKRLATFRQLAKDYGNAAAAGLPQPPRRHFEINSLVELGLKAEDYEKIKTATTVLQQGFLQNHVSARPRTREPVPRVQQLKDINLLHQAFLAATAIDEEKGEVVWEMDFTSQNNVFYRSEDDRCRFCFEYSPSDKSCPNCRSWYQRQAIYRGHPGLSLVFIDDDLTPVDFLALPNLRFIPQTPDTNVR